MIESLLQKYLLAWKIRQVVIEIWGFGWIKTSSGWWFGTMELYDFPFSWEFRFFPTDEVHHFSE